MKNIALLGSTGSIGQSTLELVAEHPDRFRVVALTAGNNFERLAEQIRQFQPKVVAVLSADDALRLQRRLDGKRPEILHGVEGLIACAAATDAEIVVSAIVGAAGLVPTMAAIESGKDIALANKETLVMAGAMVLEAVARKGVRLHPVDSEHSAIFQALEGHRHKDVRRLILTASGGPFRSRSLAELQHVTPQEALAHPNWCMGRKISIDSATMMNKGLEVIEARWLFGLPAAQIDVHVHPQSIVHSMVEYIDGSVIAQMGIPDMKTPIAYALSYPERLPLRLPPLDLCALGKLTFESPDNQRFACLPLAYQALEEGGTAPAVLNAANEVAVEAFLQGRAGFLAIPSIIEQTLNQLQNHVPSHIDEILLADRWARKTARQVIDSNP